MNGPGSQKTCPSPVPCCPPRPLGSAGCQGGLAGGGRGRVGEGHRVRAGAWPLQGVVAPACRVGGRRREQSVGRGRGIVMGTVGGGAASRLRAGGLGALRRGAPSEGCRVRAAGTRGAAVGSRVCVKVASAESGVRCEEAGSQVWVGGRGQGLGLGRMVWCSHRGLCVRASARTGTLTAAAPMDGCVWSAQRTGRPGAGFRGRLGDASAGAPNQASPCASVPICPASQPPGALRTNALSRKVCSMGINAQTHRSALAPTPS